MDKATITGDRAMSKCKYSIANQYGENECEQMGVICKGRKRDWCEFIKEINALKQQIQSCPLCRNHIDIKKNGK